MGTTQRLRALVTLTLLAAIALLVLPLAQAATPGMLAAIQPLQTSQRATMVAAGDSHTCALTDAGAVYCWGGNSFGQLGDGSATNRRAPVLVSGLASGVRAISAKGNHTCALTSGGGVVCWGSNQAGQLGDGTTTNRTTPVAVTNLSSGVRAVSVGGVHTCALSDAGQVYCWGDNFHKQLGNLQGSSSTPVAVNGLSGSITALAAGTMHTLALTDAGGVLFWGRRESLVQVIPPAYVSGLSSGVTNIAAGPEHSCAGMSDGSARCWGSNFFKQLGSDSPMVLAPVQVPGLYRKVVELVAGGGPNTSGGTLLSSHTCALMDPGAVACWGRNNLGQLGSGSTEAMLRSQPGIVVGLNRDVVSIAAGYLHTCAAMATGEVRCWGGNESSQLGDGTTTQQASPVAVVGFGPVPTDDSGVIYVNHAATGANNGASWANAYKTLQDALFLARSGDEIWVAAGTYYPDEGGSKVNNDPNASFALKHGVAIYGGFAGNETERSQRNWNTHRTILSGDIEQNDLANPITDPEAQIVGINSSNVVLSVGNDASVRLDGFAVTAGYRGILSSGSANFANLTVTGNRAGIRIQDGEPVLFNIEITNSHSPFYGCGLNIDRGKVIFINGIISGNGGCIGAGVSVENATVEFYNVLISGNSNHSYGTVHIDDGSMKFVNSTITGNSSLSNAGGVFNASGGRADVRFYNSIIWNNQDDSGIGTAASSINTIQNTTFHNSLVQGYDLGGSNLNGTLVSSDPKFEFAMAPVFAPTTDGDYRLRMDSPAIDAGSNTWLPDNLTIDLSGAIRIVSEVVDLGPYEFGAEPNPDPTIPDAYRELPPTDAHRQLLPGLREFQFGTQVSTRSEDYRSEPITFNLPITRYYGYFGSNNRNFSRLVDHEAHLTLRVFDLDPFQRSEVQVNGCTLSVVSQFRGQNNRWNDITLPFPSSCLNFPDAPALRENQLDNEDIPHGTRLTPANNTITIVIDDDKRGYKSHVAWARITVGGVRPVLYLHGFDPECSGERTRALGKIREFLNNDGIPNLGARNDGAKSIETQADDLLKAYVEMTRIYGLRSINTPGVEDPDRILLLGHSMGGLTGRRFVNLQHTAGNLIVEQFVALATPNNGSALAELGDIFKDIGKGCNDEASHDLSQDYVQKTFNPANNLSQSWSSWSSRYGGSDSSDSSANHMASVAATPFTGNMTDGVVETKNTFGLGYDQDIIFHCSLNYNNENCSLFGGEALHNKIVNFQSVYNALKDVEVMGIGQIVTSRDALGRPATATLATEAQVAELVPVEEEPAEFATIFTHADTLNAGTGQSVSFTVDPMRELLVSVRTEATELAFALRSPSGTLTQAEGGFVTIANPEVGTWQVVLAAPSQTTNYQIVAEGDADLLLTPDSQAQIVRGSSGQLAVIVNDGGSGMSGLSVTGQVRLPGVATPSTITFSPDPQRSGRYVANVNPSQLGPILALVQISGQRTGGASFTRETLLASLAIAGGIIDPNYREITGEDSSNDGLYNRLQVTLRLNLPSAGAYNVSAGLQRAVDGQGFAASQTTVNGTLGNNTVTLNFDGGYLGALNFNEQVRLAFVQVSAEDGTVLDVRSQVGANFTLQSSQFQRPLLRATFSEATPVDLNGDGRFDELVFTGQFITEVADSFTIEATLIDPQGQPFSFSEQTQTLAAGTHTLRIPFRGVDIMAQGQSGVFTLSGVVITPQTLEHIDPLRLQNAFLTGQLQSSAFAQAARLTLASNMSVARAVVHVLPETANYVFAQGQEITLEVVKLDETVNFLGWRVDGNLVTTPTLTITMDGDRTVEALFPQTVYLPLVRR